ncbi:prostatic acid phosphatase-like [Anticarsia gemmatalis]|uniref:prostatic acid phosphatase-like n=1 Tax=Anticarsia gemmatalis TaxID=129554 RepID=UPI003F757C3F
MYNAFVFKLKHVCACFLTFLFISSVGLGLYLYEESTINQTELVLTFMVFRHGDRAPVENSLPYVTDRKKVLKLLRNVGFGQLTNAGKLRSYKVGAFIRRRYNGLLSPQYNFSEIYIRSTDSTRTKMSILAAMAALYPSEDSICKDIPARSCERNNWNLVPYTTEHPKYDYNLAIVNCPKLKKRFEDAFEGPAPEMSKYFKFLERWSKIVDYNFTKQPNMAYFVYDVYNAQISLGVPIGRKLEKIYPEIEEAAGAAINGVFGTEDQVVLAAGVLLNEFFEVAHKIMSGEDVPRVHVYSAHDVNVYDLMAATRVTPRQGVPKYGALYALELRRLMTSGEYIVVPVYLKTPDKDEVTYLQVDGCEGFCNFTTFKSLVSKNVLDVKEWRNQCGWTEDLEVDYKLFA